MAEHANGHEIEDDGFYTLYCDGWWKPAISSVKTDPLKGEHKTPANLRAGYRETAHNSTSAVA